MNLYQRRTSYPFCSRQHGNLPFVPDSQRTQESAQQSCPSDHDPVWLVPYSRKRDSHNTKCQLPRRTVVSERFPEREATEEVPRR